MVSFGERRPDGSVVWGPELPCVVRVGGSVPAEPALGPGELPGVPDVALPDAGGPVPFGWGGLDVAEERRRLGRLRGQLRAGEE